MTITTRTRPRRKWRLLPALILRPERALALPAAGAVIGLAIAGIGLFHAATRPPRAVPAGYAALVNGEPILMSDYIQEVQDGAGMPFQQTTPAQRKKTLHDMITQELLVQRGLALNVPETDSDVRTAIGDSVKAQIAAPVLADRPTEAQLRAYYRAHRDHYATQGQMRFYDLLLRYGHYQDTDQTLNQAEADAAEAAFQLRSGASLAYVEHHFGLADSGNGNGQTSFDFAAKIHLGPKLFAIADKMTDGQISEPVAQPDGVHVLVMEHRQPPIYTDFNDVRSNVYTDYQTAEKQKAQDAELKRLRQRATVLLAPGLSE